MSIRLRKRNRRGGRRADDPVREPGDSLRKTDAAARWDFPTSRVAKPRAMPRLISFLFAIVVVTVLTVGLHMLYQ
jgi:hypothetical protein